MNRPRALIVTCLATALLLSLAPTSLAVHNNQGTIKVHDNEDENPDQRNVPHVDCDFWIEGFNLGDDSGWLVFFAWPPTGDKSMIDSGEDQNWTADPWDEEHGFHFLAGPYSLPSGHYRVEVYTDEGHPGETPSGGNPHFAKAKTFWVECEEVPPVNPPCPVILDVVAASEDGNPTITLTWESVVDADAYVVYRAVEGGEFEMLDTTTETTFVDSNVTVGTTYEYYVTAVVDGFESENCQIVEATAIPFFPNVAVGAIAALGALGAFVLLRRKA